ANEAHDFTPWLLANSDRLGDALGIDLEPHVNFFGVQVSVVRIGESLPAPLFDVVAKPNTWQKRVRATARAGTISGRAEQYRRFWTRYLDRMRKQHPSWSRRSTPQPANWMTFGAAMPGTQIGVSFAAGRRLRHELYIDTGDADANTELFDSLRARAPELEAAYGRALDFDDIPGNARVASPSTRKATSLTRNAGTSSSTGSSTAADDCAARSRWWRPTGSVRRVR
ncbi:MAG TPA: DUF4268 domain-containing protein, partial [Acidimicrobiales bacterium]